MSHGASSVGDVLLYPGEREIGPSVIRLAVSPGLLQGDSGQIIVAKNSLAVEAHMRRKPQAFGVENDEWFVPRALQLMIGAKVMKLPKWASISD